MKRSARLLQLHVLVTYFHSLPCILEARSHVPLVGELSKTNARAEVCSQVVPEVYESSKTYAIVAHLLPPPNGEYAVRQDILYEHLQLSAATSFNQVHVEKFRLVSVTSTYLLSYFHRRTLCAKALQGVPTAATPGTTRLCCAQYKVAC